MHSAVQAGEVVDYAVTPIYRGAGLRPTAVTLKARGSGGLSFEVTLSNRRW